MISILRLLSIQIALALSILVPLHAVDGALPGNLTFELSQDAGEDQDSGTFSDVDVDRPSQCGMHCISFLPVRNSPPSYSRVRQTVVVAHIRAPPSSIHS
ncbi:MAG: hypothetical protein H6998_00605 [Hahellaceae bacterium]|nr:hypothetical protein [Hahellaceae bacterium]